MYPFGPVLGVVSSVAPWALGFIPTPGFADWAFVIEATNAAKRAILVKAIIK